MDKQDETTQDFELEDILREFGDSPDPELLDQQELEQVFAQAEQDPVQEDADIKSDTIRFEPVKAPAEAVDAENARQEASEEEPGEALDSEDGEELPDPGAEESEESGDSGEAEDAEEPQEDQPSAPDAPKNAEPIPFDPRAKIRELKRKLVAGPERRYYELAEAGLGKLQIGIFVNLLLVGACAAVSSLFHQNLIPEERLRLVIFSQALAMMVSATLSCYCLLDGITDLFRARFSLNAMLVLTLAACAADAVLCLRQERIPCCAAFSLEAAFALWQRYEKRNTEMGQMDTLRKASRLGGVVKVPDFYQGTPGLLRGEGRLEDFMDHYEATSGPERVQMIYTFISFLICIGISVLAGLLHGFSMGIQILATSLLVATPASFFVCLTRPMAVLERRLHMVGTVLCGWQGVKRLSGKAAFPLSDGDLFPAGSIKFNGVKFYGDRDPDQVVAYATALIRCSGDGLEPIFTQMLKNRSGAQYQAEAIQEYPSGGLGGEVWGESVLMGSAAFLQEMGVEIPDGTMVNQAVYCAIDGQLSAVFAIAYTRMRSSAAGIVSLCAHKKLQPVLTAGDFMLTDVFLKNKFGVNTKRIVFPDKDTRLELAGKTPGQEDIALALTTQDTLTATAYAVGGSRALRSAYTTGLVIHILGGVLGMLIMLALGYLGSVQLLTPMNVLLYQLVWAVPGLLITEWTRTV